MRSHEACHSARLRARSIARRAPWMKAWRGRKRTPKQRLKRSWRQEMGGRSSFRLTTEEGEKAIPKRARHGAGRGSISRGVHVNNRSKMAHKFSPNEPPPATRVGPSRVIQNRGTVVVICGAVVGANARGTVVAAYDRGTVVAAYDCGTVIVAYDRGTIVVVNVRIGPPSVTPRVHVTPRPKSDGVTCRPACIRRVVLSNVLSVRARILVSILVVTG